MNAYDTINSVHLFLSDSMQRFQVSTSIEVYTLKEFSKEVQPPFAQVAAYCLMPQPV